MPSAIIIGAGIGGLTAGARLARAGYRVTVLEKAAVPGGRAGVITHGGYRFDTGPTLFLMPEVFAETFAALGERMEDHLNLQRVDPVYRLHFHDGSRLDLTGHLPHLREQLEAMEPGSFNAFLRFLAEGERNYRLSLSHFVGRNFYNLAEYFSLGNLPLLFQLKALLKHADNTGRFFRDPRLRAAFSFQNMYLGLSPYDAPATYSLLQYTELADGVYFPEGGLYRVIERLAAIAEAQGVRFLYNTPVKEIVVEGNRAAGVRLADGKTLKADLVLANADLPYVYRTLLGEPHPRAERLSYSCSAFLMYLGVRRQYPGLPHHTLVVPPDLRGACGDIFTHHRVPPAPPYYICNSSKTDPSLAPPGCENLYVLVPVPSQAPGREIDWAAEGPRLEGEMLLRLERFGLPGLRKHLVTGRTFTPADFAGSFSATRGEAFGLAHGLDQVGYLRPHNRHPKYRNLYFVGQSTHPGCGIPMVLISARLVSERMAEEQGIVG